MNKTKWIVLGVVVLAILYVWSSYNKLVSYSQSADAQWAQVESQYQRRFDLIPNLVNAVKGAFTQEQAIIKEIADARTQYSGAKTPDAKAAAASQVESSFGRLLVAMEAYPQLGSIQAVRDLQVQLEGTENRISVERMRYNDIVKNYNVLVKRFPLNLVSGMFGYSPRAYFESVALASTAPVVNLQ